MKRARTACGVAFLAVLFNLPAQNVQSTAQNPDDTAPQEPAWKAPAAPGVGAYDSTAQDQDNPAGTTSFSTSSSPAGSAADTASPSTADPSSADASASSPGGTAPSSSLPPSIVEPEMPQLGVPSSQNSGLPDFSAVQPWFQMEGLRMNVGPAQIRFDLDMNFGYNDNIFGLNTPKVGDYITTISPTIELGIGKYPRQRSVGPTDDQANFLVFNYTPSLQFFAENSDQNTVNENLLLKGHYAFSRLVLEGNFSYVETANPTPADIGRQKYATYSAELKGNYLLTQKIFLQLTLDGSYQEYLEISNSKTTTVSASPALGYKVGPKLELTLGPEAGITYVDGGGEQPFQGVLLGFTYDTLRKLRFKGSFGYQATQFRENNPSGSKDFTSPVFSLGATYDIDPTSSVALDLLRSVSTAGTSNGQTYINTGVTLSVQKVFWERIRLQLSSGLQSLEYQGGDSRTDTYFTFTGQLGYLFWQSRCSTYLTYTRTQRFSEQSDFEYDANFIGTGIGVEF